MPLFNLAGGRQLNYELSPAPSTSAPLIILSTPLSSSLALWDAFLPHLAKAGYRVLRFDHPGHGKSTCPDDTVATITFPSMAVDVRKLLAYLSGDECPKEEKVALPAAAWMGISMGAALGVFYTVAYPNTIKNLVLVDTISCSPERAGVPDLFTGRVASARKDGNMAATIEGTLDRWYGNRLSPETRDQQRAQMSSTTLNGFEACCAALVHNSFDIRPLASMISKSITGDVLVVVGALDANLPETMAELARSIEQGFRHSGKKDYTVPVKIIPESGHIPVVDNFDSFVDTVMPFLSNKV